MKKKEITGLNNIRYIIITLGGLNPDNVDYIYNKRLQYFYYQNSSQKEITDNDEGLKHDEQGNIINATFNKIYGTGLQIPETTFIENELNIINKIDLTQLENSQKDLVRFYKQYLGAKQQTFEPEQPETDKPDEVTIKHPKHNPNYWNTDCFELFKYLYDEYYKGTRRQLTNIWFYLKEYRNKDYINKKYILSITKDLYKDFIKENYGIVITNFDKAQQKWEDTEYRKLDEHRQNFEDGLK